MSAARPLLGQRILVLEDDYFVAMDTADLLVERGAEVLGPASSVEEALAILREEEPDLAVVDLNLGKGPTFEVPARLLALRVPFLFATGYAEATIPGQFDAIPRLEKPFSGPALIRALCLLRPDRHGGEAVIPESD